MTKNTPAETVTSKMIIATDGVGSSGIDGEGLGLASKMLVSMTLYVVVVVTGEGSF